MRQALHKRRAGTAASEFHREPKPGGSAPHRKRLAHIQARRCGRADEEVRQLRSAVVRSDRDLCPGHERRRRRCVRADRNAIEQRFEDVAGRGSPPEARSRSIRGVRGGDPVGTCMSLLFSSEGSLAQLASGEEKRRRSETMVSANGWADGGCLCVAEPEKTTSHRKGNAGIFPCIRKDGKTGFFPRRLPAKALDKSSFSGV